MIAPVLSFEMAIHPVAEEQPPTSTRRPSPSRSDGAPAHVAMIATDRSSRERVPGLRVGV